MNLHRSQTFFYILISFIAGVFAGSFFNIYYNIALIVAIICSLLIAIFYRRGSRLLNLKLALGAFLALFFVAGVLRFNAVNSQSHNLQKFAEAQENIIDPKNHHPIKVTLSGYISSEPVISGNSQKLVFYAKQLTAGQYIIRTDEKTLVTMRLYPRYKYGDQLSLYGNIRRPENWNDFDYKAYLAKDAIFTTVFYPNVRPANLKLSFYEKTKIAVFSKIFIVKNVFERSIARSVPEPNASFIGGILLGSRSQIPQDIKDAFARTSTSHILAVSGYNITIIALVIYWFFLLFFRRQVAFWFSLTGIVLFTILTGAEASVVRAAIMGVIVLLAHREGRLNDPRNAIALAGAAMILINPMILRYDVGFQLSFVATLGLIYLAPAIEKYFEKLPAFFELRETMVMTVSAQISVLPLLLYYFKSFSLTSLPANLIILPTIPLAMILGAASGVAGLILPLLGQVVGYLAWLLTAAELYIIEFFAKPSWAAVPIEINFYTVTVVYVILILLVIRLKRTKSVIEK